MYFKVEELTLFFLLSIILSYSTNVCYKMFVLFLNCIVVYFNRNLFIVRYRPSIIATFTAIYEPITSYCSKFKTNFKLYGLPALI